MAHPIPATKRPVLLKHCRAVLTKWNFTNFELIPPGIDQNETRLCDALLDREHAHDATRIGRPDLAEVGRHREGRVDTGEKVWENVKRLQVAFLQKGMQNNGLHVAGCRWYVHAIPGRQTKAVVEVIYTDNPKYKMELTRVQRDALRILSRASAWTGHIWYNPDDTCTVNLVLREPDVTPTSAVVVRDGKIVVIPTEKWVAMNDE